MSDLMELAGKFLQESVFASREQSHGFGSGNGGQCGLGERPAIPQEWSERQGRLLEQMLGAAGCDLSEQRLAAVRESMASWIKVQDGLDRKRNHFLKDFRNAHGFDRRAYPPDVEAQFAEGIGRINDENRRQLESHAQELSGIF